MNVAQLERDLATQATHASALLEKYSKAAQAHEERDADGKVTVKGRLLTKEERAECEAAAAVARATKQTLEAAKGDDSLRAEIERMTAGMAGQRKAAIDEHKRSTSNVFKSLGQQYVESDSYAWLKETRRVRGTRWNSPSSELYMPELQAATLTENAASGGDLVIPDYKAGILPILFKRLTVRDLMSPGRTDSNLVSYMKETTATNAAATVTEGAAKPESTLIFDLVSDPVQKIATWLPVTDEMLEDVPQIRSYIDARLRLFVQLTEEDQLLNGDGTPPNISGILDRTGLTAAQARGADTNADAIFKEMMKIFNASFLMPDAHVINPTNWQTIQLAKDANGQYYGSGPFAGPQAPTLWGLPAVVTPSIAAGTALSGAFKAASQIFDKGGIRVETSNSHNDYFVKNLVAILAEERLALAVYREAAFGTTTGLN